MNYKKYLKSKKRMNEVAKKGDTVKFYGTDGQIYGTVLSVNGNVYTIDGEDGTQYQIQWKDLVNEVYGFVGMSGRSSSLTDPPKDRAPGTAASLRGEMSDMRKQLAKVAELVKSGDMEGAAKLAVAGVFEYGSEFKEKLSGVSDEAYKKAYDEYKNGKKDEPTKKDKSKDKGDGASDA
jgi:hypothetical protein